MKVPEILNKDVIKLCFILGIPTPSLATVQPEAYSEHKNCFPSVEKKLRKDGGQIVFGWQFWAHHYFIEAEFHAVWKSPDSALVDITKHPIYLPNILFAEDIERTFKGIQVDNVRLNATENKLVDDLIKLHEAKFRMENRGERAFQTGEIRMVNQEADLYRNIEYLIGRIGIMLEHNCTIQSICFCDKNLSYENCHQIELNRLIKMI